MRSAGISLRRSILRLFVSRARARLGARHYEDQGGNAMKLPRRTFLRLAAGVAALPVVCRIAQARHDRVNCLHPSRQAARAGSDHYGAVRTVAGPADLGRFRAGLRSEPVVRNRRAQEHADGAAISLPNTGNAGSIRLDEETEKWGKVCHVP